MLRRISDLVVDLQKPRAGSFAMTALVDASWYRATRVFALASLLSNSRSHVYPYAEGLHQHRPLYGFLKWLGLRCAGGEAGI